MPETKIAVLVLSAIVFAGVGCASMQHAGPTLEITADACERIALEHDREDIAERCRQGGDLAAILSQLLREAE